MPKVLIAEDDFTHADMVAQALIKGGYEVCGIARSVREGIELGERHKPDLAIIDVHLADGDLGTAISARLRRNGILGVLYTTADPAVVALTYGDACLGKPFAPEDIVHALKIVERTVGIDDVPWQVPRQSQVLRYPKERREESAEMAAATLKIARLLRQQAALAQFGSFAFRENDLDKILMEAARVCAECLGVRFCKICEYRPEKGDLLVVAGVGWHQGILGHVVSQADQSSPQGRAFITGQPVICPDLNAEPGFELPPIYAEHGIVSSVNVIIKGNGKPFGVLEIDSPDHHSYDEHDVDFLTGFANVLAEAVSTTKRNALLRAAVGRMKDLVDDKDRLLAENNVILNEKSQILAEKTLLAHELQHRVRNNLQLVYGMLRTQHKNGQPDINSIARRVMTLAKVHDHLLGTGLTRTIDAGGYLESLCAGYRELETGQGHEIEVNCLAEPLSLDLNTVTVLGLVTAELISNSYRHAFPNGKGVISLSLKRSTEAEEATILFHDDGVGFVKDNESNRHGLGLVERLMKQINGSAELSSGFDSPANQGTTWVLKFPVPKAVASYGSVDLSPSQVGSQSLLGSGPSS